MKDVQPWGQTSIPGLTEEPVDYGVCFKRRDDGWVLLFPGLPHHPVAASTCSELMRVAQSEMDKALCTFFGDNGKLPAPTCGGHARLAPSWSLLRRLDLTSEICRRLQAVSPVWAVVGVEEDDVADLSFTKAEVLAFVLKLSDEEVAEIAEELLDR